MFTLPELPYEYDSLESFIDAQTMEVHHSKHHQGYTDKFNAALEDHPDLLEKDAADLLRNIEDLPADIQAGVRNNGGGYVNHSLFWTILSPEESKPEGELLAAIKAKFESLKNFKEEFEAVASTQFGSGWAWLVVDADGDLQVYSTSNQDSPLSEDETPILCLDVWEHAYYLKYQNRRPDYIKSFWSVVNWKEVARLFSEATA
jgi:superoxide dismutase, Fe-Mn family